MSELAPAPDGPRVRAAGDPPGLLLAVMASNACAVFSAWTIPLQLAQLTGELGWSNADAGAVIAAVFLLIGVTILSATHFIARFPGKTFSIAGARIATLGFLIAAAAPGAPFLCTLGLMLSGCGQGLASVGMSALAAASISPGRTFGISATLGILHSSGWIVALPAIANIPVAGDALFLGCAAATAICLAVILLSRVPAAKRALAAAARVRYGPDALAPLAANFILISGASAVWTFTQPLGARIGIDAQDFGVALAVATAASMAGSLGIVWLDRASGLGVAIGFAAAVTAATLLLTCITASTAVFVAGLIGQSFGQIYFVNLVYLMCIRRDATGRLAALSRSATLFGAAAGPLIGGYLMNIGNLALAIGAVALCGLGWTFAAASDRRRTGVA